MAALIRRSPLTYHISTEDRHGTAVHNLWAEYGQTCFLSTRLFLIFHTLVKSLVFFVQSDLFLSIVSCIKFKELPLDTSHPRNFYDWSTHIPTPDMVAWQWPDPLTIFRPTICQKANSQTPQTSTGVPGPVHLYSPGCPYLSFNSLLVLGILGPRVSRPSC